MVCFLGGSLLFKQINVEAPCFYPTASTVIPTVPLAVFSVENAVKHQFKMASKNRTQV